MAKKQAEHDVQVFGTVDGQFYWSCSCASSGQEVATQEAATAGAERHVAGKSEG